jgi:hypothetical protein
MVATGRLLFGAGFVTTTNLIGNGMVTFFRHPGEMARFWADPRPLAVTAVDEILRYESVVQTNGRWVFEPIELGEEKIDAGQVVIPLIGGANRDPERSASDGASTTAWAPRWPGWRPRSCSPVWPSASPGSSRPGPSPASTPRSCGACPPSRSGSLPADPASARA